MMPTRSWSPPVVLREISRPSAAAVAAGQLPDDVRVASDYPTEFSAEVADSIDDGAPLGPYFLHRNTDDVVVGEIGGTFVAPRTIEIGYAVVASCRGNGYATTAVLAFLVRACAHPDIDRLVAHTPLDRPASARVLLKAGFTRLGETNEDYGGPTIRVSTWAHPAGRT